MNSALWVKEARRGAGLSQRELSRRSGVAQSAIARIELGQQIPRADTLERLVAACGFELRLGLSPGGGVDRSEADSGLIRQAAEAEHVSLSEFVIRSARSEAVRVLADRTSAVIAASDWDAIEARLAQPGVVKPELARLFAMPSPFDR